MRYGISDMPATENLEEKERKKQGRKAASLYHGMAGIMSRQQEENDRLPGGGT